jgi:hypothetical protein
MLQNYLSSRPKKTHIDSLIKVKQLSINKHQNYRFCARSTPRKERKQNKIKIIIITNVNGRASACRTFSWGSCSFWEYVCTRQFSFPRHRMRGGSKPPEKEEGRLGVALMADRHQGLRFLMGRERLQGAISKLVASLKAVETGVALHSRCKRKCKRLWWQ